MKLEPAPMQELWKKHNYNPMGGCLLAFVQLPIFIGLYRSLMIDVELHGAPLFRRGHSLVLELGRAGYAFYWGDWGTRFLFAKRDGWDRTSTCCH